MDAMRSLRNTGRFGLPNRPPVRMMWREPARTLPPHRLTRSRDGRTTQVSDDPAVRGAGERQGDPGRGARPAARPGPRLDGRRLPQDPQVRALRAGDRALHLDRGAGPRRPHRADLGAAYPDPRDAGAPPARPAYHGPRRRPPQLLPGRA